MPSRRRARAPGAKRRRPRRARPAAAPPRNVSGERAPDARPLQGTERAVQALRDASRQSPAEPDDRRTHARDRRRIARVAARGVASRLCRRHVLAETAPPLRISGRDAPVTEVSPQPSPLPGPLAGVRVLELADET